MWRLLHGGWVGSRQITRNGRTLELIEIIWFSPLQLKLVCLSCVFVCTYGPSTCMHSSAHPLTNSHSGLKPLNVRITLKLIETTHTYTHTWLPNRDRHLQQNLACVCACVDHLPIHPGRQPFAIEINMRACVCVCVCVCECVCVCVHWSATYHYTHTQTHTHYLSTQWIQPFAIETIENVHKICFWLISGNFKCDLNSSLILV